MQKTAFYVFMILGIWKSKNLINFSKHRKLKTFWIERYLIWYAIYLKLKNWTETKKTQLFFCFKKILKLFWAHFYF